MTAFPSEAESPVMYPLARRILFALDAEKAHHFTLDALNMVYKLGLIPINRQPYQTCKTDGFGFAQPCRACRRTDKNGEYIDALGALGFGFIEIGTVTPNPQPGNPQPRLFRVPEYQGIINRMGFNNHGIDAMIQNIEKSKFSGVLGINIGKNAVTPIENAADDYLICLEKAYAHASYITVNISSPNTKNLRALQGGDELSALLEALKNKQAQLASVHGNTSRSPSKSPPIWMKHKSKTSPTLSNPSKWTASSLPIPPSTNQVSAAIRSQASRAV